MLESISERLMETVHAGSPTKHPARRLETIRAAGALRIPFTTGTLVGIGETRDERFASIDALAEVHAEYGHLQEIILQNFVPHRRYYGRDTGVVATEPLSGTGAPGSARPRSTHSQTGPARSRSTISPELIAYTRAQLPTVAIQVPPNLYRVLAGPRGGGRDRSGRPLRQRRSHLAGAPVPLTRAGARGLEPRGYAARRAPLRAPPFLTPEWQAPPRVARPHRTPSPASCRGSTAQPPSAPSLAGPRAARDSRSRRRRPRRPRMPSSRA